VYDSLGFDPSGLNIWSIRRRSTFSSIGDSSLAHPTIPAVRKIPHNRKTGIGKEITTTPLIKPVHRQPARTLPLDELNLRHPHKAGN
jgi:hypothetical protein